MIQVIPDRWVDKYSNLFVIANSLCTNPEQTVYEVLLERNKIAFYYIHPDEFFLQEELKVTFPRSTFRECQDYMSKFTDVACCQMELEHSYALALKTDRRETSPIADIINIARILEEDEYALMQLLMNPVDKDWYQECRAIQEQIKTDKTEPKFNSNYFTTLAFNIIGKPLLTLENAAKYLLGNSDKTIESITAPLNIGEFSANTNSKPFNHALECQLRFMVHGNRKNHILRLLASSLRDLEGDNKFIPSSIKPEYIFERKRKTYLSDLTWWNYDLCILSSVELERFLQMPSYTLQMKLPQTEVIMNTESIIPDKLLEQGILLGKTRVGSKQKEIYLPCDNKDECCKLWVNIGGTRSGKSTKMGNFTVEALRQGCSVVVIDPVGLECEKIRDGIPKGLIPESHILHFDFSRRDYLPAIKWTRPKGIRDYEMDADSYANVLLNFFIMQSDTDMGERTKRYFRSSARQTGDLLDIGAMFANKDFAMKQLEKTQDPAIKRLWEKYWQNGKEKDSYAEPILSRLEMMTGDEIVSACILQRPKYTATWDMYKWLNGNTILNKRIPYCVLISIPTGKIYESADALATYIMYDILLAAKARDNRNTPISYVLVDEPHQMLGSAKGGVKSTWGKMVAELPKFGVGLQFYMHSLISEQIPKGVKDVIKGANPNYSLFQTDPKEFEALQDIFSPIEKEEFISLPRFESLNRILYNNEYHLVQIHGLDPLVNYDKRKEWRFPFNDRSDLTLKCHKTYGKSLQEIRQERYKRQELIYGGV